MKKKATSRPLEAGGKTIDFEKARRRRRFTENVKRLLVLAGMILAVGGVLVANSIMVEKGLSTKISDIVESWGGQGFPTDLPGGTIRDVKGMGGSLVVLNDTNLYMYNSKAKAVANIQQMTDKTVLKTTDKRALTYDIGGKTYRLHTPSRTLGGEVENGIFAADMNGELYAFATASRQFVAEVTVYKNPGEKHLFRWSSPDNHVTGVSLSPKGNMMAVSCAATEDGMMVSLLNLFHFSMTERVAQVRFPDSLIVQTDFYSADRIGVLTDREYMVLDSTGRTLFHYPLDTGPATAYRRMGKEVLLLVEHKETRRSEIILLDESGKEKARLEGANNIAGVEMSQRRIYVLDDGGISIYNHTMELQDRLDQRGISRIRLVGSRLYYCTQEEICVL